MPTTCKFPGCTKKGGGVCYAFKKDDKLKFCREHRETGMKDVMKPTCQYTSCDIKPSFGYIDRKPTHCKEHSKVDMRNVMDKMCECGKKRPTFGIPGKRPTHCFSCPTRTGEMKQLVSKMCCDANCDLQANFGFPKDGIALFCSNHQKDGMENVKSKKCSNSCGSLAEIPRYKGLCFKCFVEANPESKFKRNFKIKENAVMDVLKSRYSDFVYDKTIRGSIYKPDAYREEDGYHLIVEIDEFQHKKSSYKTRDDDERISNIFWALGGEKPLRVIRLNTDGYDNVRSPWENGRGKDTMIRDIDEWENRMMTLIETIDNGFSNGEVICSINLFYNSSS